MQFWTASLYSCKRPLTINTEGCAVRKWQPMGLYFFADNNYFCWTGRVFGWEECVPYFHG